MEMGYHAAQVARFCDGDPHPEPQAPSPKPKASSPKPQA